MHHRFHASRARKNNKKSCRHFDCAVAALFCDSTMDSDGSKDFISHVPPSRGSMLLISADWYVHLGVLRSDLWPVNNRTPLPRTHSYTLFRPSYAYPGGSFDSEKAIVSVSCPEAASRSPQPSGGAVYATVTRHTTSVRCQIVIRVVSCNRRKFNPGFSLRTPNSYI